MQFDWTFISPALLGFLSGVLGPLIVEKWKGKRDERIKLSTIENDIINLQNSFKDFSSALESRLAATEERARVLEINISHNTGVLKGKLSDTPLEDTPINLQTPLTGSK